MSSSGGTALRPACRLVRRWLASASSPECPGTRAQPALRGG